MKSLWPHHRKAVTALIQSPTVIRVLIGPLRIKPSATYCP